MTYTINQFTEWVQNQRDNESIEPKKFSFTKGNFTFDNFFFIFLFFVLAKGIKKYGINTVMSNIDRIAQRIIEFSRIHPLTGLAGYGLAVDIIKDCIYPTVDVNMTIFAVPIPGGTTRVQAPLSLALAEDLQVWADRINSAFTIQQIKDFSTAMGDLLKSVSPIVTTAISPVKASTEFFKSGTTKKVSQG